MAASARWMGVVPAVLKAKKDKYNVFCDDKHDGLFIQDR